MTNGRRSPARQRVADVLRLVSGTETCAACGKPIRGRAQKVTTEGGVARVVHRHCAGTFRDRMEVK